MNIISNAVIKVVKLPDLSIFIFSMKDEICFYPNATLKTTDLLYLVIFKIKTVIGMTFWYVMKKNQKLQYLGPKIFKQQTNLDK